MKSMIKYLLSLLLLVTLGASSCEKENLSEDADYEELKRLETEIRALVANKSCAAERTCGAIAFGSKPCGGPWSYLVYSLNAADLQALTAKVEAYNQREAELNRKYDRGSDCALAVASTVGCVDGTCTVK